MLSVRPEDIEEVDSFLAVPKTLEGGHPPWTESTGPNQIHAIWNIADDVGIVRAHLRFRVSPMHPGTPSVSLVFEGNAVYRLDLEDDATIKRNPPWAAQFGLPAYVSGSHVHCWEHNRQHIQETGRWELPCRHQLNPQLRRVPQALAWMADRVGIHLEHEQRGFDIPPRSHLFGWGQE